MVSRSDPVRVEGLSKLRRDLRKMGADLSQIKEANARTGALVLPRAQAKTPRKSGALAGSGRVSRALNRVTLLFGRASLPYGPVQHWGWPKRGIAASLFATDAAAETESTWTEFYVKEVEAALDHIESLY
jgi:hypothetical protein